MCVYNINNGVLATDEPFLSLSLSLSLSNGSNKVGRAFFFPLSFFFYRLSSLGADHSTLKIKLS